MEDYIFFKKMFNNVENISKFAAPSYEARLAATGTVKYHSSWFNVIPLKDNEKTGKVLQKEQAHTILCC
jgi:hypothetical protein